MKRSNSFIIALIVLCSGCNQFEPVNKELTLFTNEFNVHSTIHSIEYKTIENEQHTFLMGDIIVKNICNDTIIINLKSFKLRSDKNEYANIYIDSRASVLIRDERLAPNKSINKKIYWAFNRGINKNELEKLKIVKN